MTDNMELRLPDRGDRARLSHQWYNAVRKGVDIEEASLSSMDFLEKLEEYITILPDDLETPHSYLEVMLAGDFIADEVGCVTCDPDEIQLSQKPGNVIFSVPSEDLDGIVGHSLFSPIESLTVNLNTGTGISTPTSVDILAPTGETTVVAGFILQISGGDQSPGGQIRLAVQAPCATDLSRLPSGLMVSYGTQYTLQLLRQPRETVEVLFLFVRQVESKLYPYGGAVTDVLGPKITTSEAPQSLNLVFRALTAGERITHLLSRFSR
jgi:hypothetical protein